MAQLVWLVGMLSYQLDYLLLHLNVISWSVIAASSNILVAFLFFSLCIFEFSVHKDDFIIGLSQTFFLFVDKSQSKYINNFIQVDILKKKFNLCVLLVYNSNWYKTTLCIISGHMVKGQSQIMLSVHNTLLVFQSPQPI